MKRIPFWRLAEDILTLYRQDQEMRDRVMSRRGKWDSRVDVRTAAFIKVMIVGMGWPRRSQIGARASSALGLLVSHVDHEVWLQERCLELMQGVAREHPGDIDLADIAYLTDRICVNRRIPQVNI